MTELLVHATSRRGGHLWQLFYDVSPPDMGVVVCNLHFASQVVSKGTEEAPFCTWRPVIPNPCIANPGVADQQACATGLCKAAGFAAGTFVSSTGTWCESGKPVESNPPGKKYRWRHDVSYSCMTKLHRHVHDWTPSAAPSRNDLPSLANCV